MEQYSRGRRGRPAKALGRVTGAEVQILSAPPLRNETLLKGFSFIVKHEVNDMYSWIYQSIIGPLCLVEEDQVLIECSFSSVPKGILKETIFLKRVIGELEEYFSNTRKDFTIPIQISGTNFQKQVYNALLSIPYGETRTYKEVAMTIGNEKASRAVGMANHNNPLALFVPCHRVIGAKGSLVGYAGGLDKKEILLKLEQKK